MATVAVAVFSDSGTRMAPIGIHLAVAAEAVFGQGHPLRLFSLPFATVALTEGAIAFAESAIYPHGGEKASHPEAEGPQSVLQ